MLAEKGVLGGCRAQACLARALRLGRDRRGRGGRGMWPRAGNLLRVVARDGDAYALPSLRPSAPLPVPVCLPLTLIEP